MDHAHHHMDGAAMDHGDMDHGDMDMCSMSVCFPRFPCPSSGD